MEGPFYGSEHPSMEEAQEKCHKLTAATKDHILIKIYSLDGIDYPKAKKMSSVHFDRVFNNMKSARLLCDTPKRKKLQK